MIVGTAGHIDHGKTALVQALTGTNTDRLPEEKRRGITIELGYAFMDAPDGQRIAFVDAPGHERLVRTMVAGASGIDHALLLIAADDGPMPQTLEHMAILSLLGIASGTVVITKTDRVEPAQVEQRQAQARALLREHGLDGYTVMATSAHSGEGIDALREHLLLASNVGHGSPDGHAHDQAHQGLRIGLDRVFTLDGTGTVVAGSVGAGAASVGDMLCIAQHGEQTWRVRGLHAHGRAVQHTSAGQRCAVGLAGLERAQVQRGHTLCDPSIRLTTLRLDVWLRLARSEERPLKSGTQVHLHLATQDVTASVAVLGAAALAPGEEGLAQIITRVPVATWHGDRLVLRDASASRTMAGGLVLDPLAPARYRQTPQRLEALASQRDADPARRFAGAVAHAPHGMDARQWMRAQGWKAWPFEPSAVTGVSFDAATQWAVSAQRQEQIAQSVLAMLRAFHGRYPDDIGPDADRARRLAAPRMPQALWRKLLDSLVAAGSVAQRAGFIHLPEHGAQLREAERVVAQRVLPLLEQGGFDPPWVRDLAGSTRIAEGQVRTVLARLAKTGEVFQIVKDLYYHPRQVQRLATLARDIHAREGQILASDYRDATGLGRKRAIQILEFLDRIGFLRRVGDTHLVRPGTPLFPADGGAPPAQQHKT